MGRTYATPYDWNVICQVCRGRVKSSETVRRWDGLLVGRNHTGCFETRSPLDMPAPPLREQMPLPFTSVQTAPTGTTLGSSSAVSVGASPFKYTVGAYPEVLLFSGTITQMVVDGSIVPAPTAAGDAVSSVIYRPGTVLYISYTGTLTITSTPITSFSNNISSIG